MSLGFPSDVGALAATLQCCALQLAKSGNNMAGEAFQFFIPPVLPACMGTAHALLNGATLLAFSGVNLAPPGQV